MLLGINSPLMNSIVTYIIVMVTIFIIKPDFLYCHDTYKFKGFGLEQGQTIMPLSCICVGSGIVIYFIFATLQSLLT